MVSDARNERTGLARLSGMHRIGIALAGTAGGLVMLVGYPTSTMGAGGTTGAGTSGTGTIGSGPTGTGSLTPTGGGTTSSPTSTATTTYTGEVADTRWGPVQVQIAVRAGRITAASAVQYPHGNGRDQEINSYALPVLAREVVAAQSAQIDMVSGATVTSSGYLSSLQSALDKAHL